MIEAPPRRRRRRQRSTLLRRGVIETRSPLLVLILTRTPRCVLYTMYETQKRKRKNKKKRKKKLIKNNKTLAGSRPSLYIFSCTHRACVLRVTCIMCIIIRAGRVNVCYSTTVHAGRRPVEERDGRTDTNRRKDGAARRETEKHETK